METVGNSFPMHLFTVETNFEKITENNVYIRQHKNKKKLSLLLFENQ